MSLGSIRVLVSDSASVTDGGGWRKSRMRGTSERVKRGSWGLVAGELGGAAGASDGSEEGSARESLISFAACS